MSTIKNADLSELNSLIPKLEDSSEFITKAIDYIEWGINYLNSSRYTTQNSEYVLQVNNIKYQLQTLINAGGYLSSIINNYYAIRNALNTGEEDIIKSYENWSYDYEEALQNLINKNITTNEQTSYESDIDVNNSAVINMVSGSVVLGSGITTTSKNKINIEQGIAEGVSIPNSEEIKIINNNESLQKGIYAQQYDIKTGLNSDNDLSKSILEYAKENEASANQSETSDKQVLFDYGSKTSTFNDSIFKDSPRNNNISNNNSSLMFNSKTEELPTFGSGTTVAAAVAGTTVATAATSSSSGSGSTSSYPSYSSESSSSSYSSGSSYSSTYSNASSSGSSSSSASIGTSTGAAVVEEDEEEKKKALSNEDIKTEVKDEETEDTTKEQTTEEQTIATPEVNFVNAGPEYIETPNASTTVASPQVVVSPSVSSTPKSATIASSSPTYNFTVKDPIVTNAAIENGYVETPSNNVTEQSVPNVNVQANEEIPNTIGLSNNGNDATVNFATLGVGAATLGTMSSTLKKEDKDEERYRANNNINKDSTEN